MTDKTNVQNSNKAFQYLSPFYDSSTGKQKVDFSTLEELIETPWVKAVSEVDDFLRYSIGNMPLL